MTYRINQREVEMVSALDGPGRYQHFIKRVADWQQLWGLRTSEGWVSCSHESGTPAFVLWPHPAYANLQAKGAWADAAPEPIDLEPFLSDWLPSMAADQVPLAIFPVHEAKAVFVSPSQLEADLRSELRQYE